VNGPLGRIGLHGRPEPLEADRGFVQASPRQHVCQPAGLDFRGQATRVLGEKPSAPTVSTLPPAGASSPLNTLSRLVFPLRTAHQTNLVAGANAERGVRQSRAPPDFDA